MTRTPPSKFELGSVLRMRALPVLVVLAASLLFTLPLWQTRFIWTADGRLHMFRIFELDGALQQGILYPRWSENLYFGYGYPVFNFYPPFSYYIVETFHLFGLDLAASLKLFFALCFPLAALGAYVLARDLFAGVLPERWQTELGAVLTAIAYTAAPYLLIDVYVRGAIAEMLALAILPFLVWALRATVFKKGASRVAPTALTLALLILSHNLTTYFAVPVLVFLALVLLFQLPMWRARGEAFVRLALGGLLGLGLAAFYWLPAFFEMGLVYVGQPEVANIPLRQRLVEHFLSVERVLQFGWLYDFVDAPWPLGLAALILAVVGLVAAWRWLDRGRKFELAYWSIVVVVTTVLVSRLAEPLWLAFPRLWVIQFPWRLTIFWTLGVALLVGLVGIAVARYLNTRPALAWGVILVLVANFVLVALVDLSPRNWTLPRYQGLTVGILARDEVSTRVPGASFFQPPIAEYLPFSAQGVPFPQLRMRREPTTTTVPPPLVELVSQKAAAWQLRVSAPEPFTLTLREFYYPDWQATLDSNAVATYPSTNFGIVSVDVPAGEHTLNLAQSSSPSMFVGNVLTTLSMVVFFGLVIYSYFRHEEQWFLPLVGLSITLFFFLVPLGRALTAVPLRITPVQVIVGDDNPSVDDPNALLRVLGYGVAGGSDNTLDVHLLWQVLRQVPQEQSMHLRLIDEQGHVLAQREQLARYGTGWMVSWPRNLLAKDQYTLALPDAPECKPYFLEIKRGNSNNFVRLGSVTIPNCPLPPLASPGDMSPLEMRFGDNISLVGLALTSPPPYTAGQLSRLVLYWRTARDLLEDYSMTIQLLDRDGNPVAQEDGIPEGGFAPTMLWLPGRTIRDTRELQLPPDVLPGLYDLKVGVYRYPTIEHLPVQVNGNPQAEDLVTIATVRVKPVPPSVPPLVNPNLAVGDSIRLVGMDAETYRADTPRARARASDRLLVEATRFHLLDLNLYWQRTSPAPIAHDYTVFLHVVDRTGNLVAQIDRQPVLSKYPTSLWEQNEVVTDPYNLDLGALPAGPYTVYAGMYDNATGARLALHNANGQRLDDDRALLGELVVSE